MIEREREKEEREIKGARTVNQYELNDSACCYITTTVDTSQIEKNLFAEP